MVARLTRLLVDKHSYITEILNLLELQQGNTDEFLKRYIAGEREFKRIYLCKANLKGQDLRRVSFAGADLRGSWLGGTDLRGAKFHDVNLELAQMEGVDLSGTEFLEVNLVKASLDGAKLCGADLELVDLSEAHLKGADLRGARLTQVKLNNTDLTGADLRGVSFRFNEINGIILDGVLLDKGLLDEFTQSNNISNVCEYVSNQGIVINPNSPIYTWEGLRFRSKAEIKIAEALDRSGVLFFPNCLARLNDSKNSKGRVNKEADFLVCHQGKWGILEVDGPHHKPESRVKEQERERLFRLNKIWVVERFDASRCYEQPNEVVKQFLQMIEALH